MVRFHTQRRAPHLVIELSGQVSGPKVRSELQDLPDTLSSLPPQFVALALYPNLTVLDADAVGPLFYFVAHLFDADPGLCVFVDGGRAHHPGLREFINQVGLKDQTVFAPTEEAGQAHIRTYLDAHGGEQ